MFNYFTKLNLKYKYAYYLVLIFTTIPTFIESRVPDRVKTSNIKYWKK